ncbi:MAG: hypothetical protein JW839_22885 [Candidatus Lokiarchaeota archaeon]|nr:hypothetical protein [Candidatus Lokiarchaeota archaeon]
MSGAKKPAKSDRICHVDTRDRPFYKFEFGNAFILFIECLGGIIASLAAFCVVMLSLPTPRDAVSFVLAIDLAIAFVLGYALTKMLFYVHRVASLKGGLYCMLVSGMHSFGVALIFTWIPNDVPGGQWLGMGFVIVAWILLAMHYKRHGKIGLFTDGLKIRSRVFRYHDIIEVSYGTGSMIEDKIPASGRGKPVIKLTPMEFEYVEKDFGIFHVYLILVTADAVYVAQSINKQSNLAQDTRNAWSRCVLGHE